MNNPNSNYPTQNEAFAHHRNQTWWAIVFPVLIAALFIVGIAILTTLASSDTLIRFSDISLIFLILPVAAVTLVVLVLFVGLIYLLGRLTGALPNYAAVAQHALHQATSFLKSMSDKAASPVITVESVMAGLQSLFNRQQQS